MQSEKVATHLSETLWCGRPFRVALSFAKERAATEEERKELNGIAEISERLSTFKEESLSFAILAYTKCPKTRVFTAALFAKEALLTSFRASLFKVRGLSEEERTALFRLFRALSDLVPKAQFQEEFFSLLTLLKEEKTPRLWKSQAEMVLEILKLPISAFIPTFSANFSKIHCNPLTAKDF